MNKEHVLKLADFIQQRGHVDFMGWTQCIAGLCVLMIGRKPDDMIPGLYITPYNTVPKVYERARNYLGITDREAQALFRLNTGSGYLPMPVIAVYGINPVVIQTVNCLRLFAMTGKVSWREASAHSGDFIHVPKWPVDEHGNPEINTAKPPFPTPDEYKAKKHPVNTMKDTPIKAMSVNWTGIETMYNKDYSIWDSIKALAGVV